MQWILIITIILVAICVLLRKKNQRHTKTIFNDGQLESIQKRVRRKLDRLENKREVSVNKGSEAHVTVPLDVIVQRLERYKRENRGNESAVKEIDTKIAKLKARYDDEIPIEAVYEIAKEVMQ